MLLFSRLLGLSALRLGKAIRLASCIVTRTGSILTEEGVASPFFFPLKTDLVQNSKRVVEQRDLFRAR